MYELLMYLVRSRTALNVLNVETLLQEEGSNIENRVAVEYSYIADDDDDDEYNTSMMASDASNLVLEQQLNVSGVRFFNNVYSLSHVSALSNFSYIKLLNTVYALLHTFTNIFLSDIVYFVHYV